MVSTGAIARYIKPGMDAARFRVVIPQPCATCNAVELTKLHKEYSDPEVDTWIYEIDSRCKCGRCMDRRPWLMKWLGMSWWDVLFLYGGLMLYLQIIEWRRTVLCMVALAYQQWRANRYTKTTVRVPISADTVGIVERAIHASSVSEKGTAYRAHGTFVHHLSNLDVPEVLKQALVVWAPLAMMGFMDETPGVRRIFAEGRPRLGAGESPKSTSSGSTRKPDPSEQLTFRGNPDVEDGAMMGTQLDGDEYGEETRTTGGGGEVAPKLLARQIGPDLIPTEVMQSTDGNLKAGLAKRVKPLPFAADKVMIKKIEKTVTALIVEVFSSKKIRDWREQNPCVEEMHSKKWSAERFRNAFEECLSDTSVKIEQEFQIKTNEALPAKGKAPRPIIQTGDKGQILMQLPVKCFEDLLFHYFEESSIKHVDKYNAMKRVAANLTQPKGNIVEGDGSAWDACCNATIRGMTENRIIEHIIEVLGEDSEVPHGWMRKCLQDMKKEFLKGKAKTDNRRYTCPLKVRIEAIRQSGHRGTSAFNYLINLVGWLCVLSMYPEKMVVRDPRDRKLPRAYRSAFDGRWYNLKYSFEGDDSALSTTEELDTEYIEQQWTSLGFRMKLKYAKDFFTFTGFDFLLGSNGTPTGTFCPEIPRNIASSSWTCSPEAKSFPSHINTIGAAAMLARAENFKDCGPMSRYFAELGIAHVKQSGDFGIGDNSAVKLGIEPCQSVQDRLHELSHNAAVMSRDMNKLANCVFGGFTKEQEAKLLSCSFDTPDCDTARYLIPLSLWDPEQYERARR